MVSLRLIYKRDRLLRALFALLVAYILTFSIAYTLEYRIYLGAVRWLTATRIVLFAVACGYLWAVRAELHRFFDPFALCVVAVIVTGAVSGLFIGKEWFTYFRHLFQYAFLLAFYLVGREVALRPIPLISIKVLSGTVLLGYAIATALYVATPGLHSGSYSFQPNLALLPVASGLSSGNWLVSLAGSLIVVVGNKRAVYLGLAVLVAVYIAISVERRWHRTLFQRFVIVGLTAPIIGAAFGIVVSSLTLTLTSYVTARIPTVLDRFTLQPTFNAGVEATPAQEAKADPIVRITSARSVEVQTVWAMVTASPARALFGHGFGSVFTVKYVSPNDYELVQFDRDQADLAPAQIALTSGLPLAVAFTILLFGLITMVFVRIGSASGTDLTVALFSIGVLLDTILGFQLTNPMCWLALGIVTSRMLPEFSSASSLQILNLRRSQGNA